MLLLLPFCHDLSFQWTRFHSLPVFPPKRSPRDKKRKSFAIDDLPLDDITTMEHRNMHPDDIVSSDEEFEDGEGAEDDAPTAKHDGDDEDVDNEDLDNEDDDDDPPPPPKSSTKKGTPKAKASAASPSKPRAKPIKQEKPDAAPKRKAEASSDERPAKKRLTYIRFLSLSVLLC